MIPEHPGLRGGPVYLHYNATTPVDPRVVEGRTRPGGLRRLGLPQRHPHPSPVLTAMGLDADRALGALR